MTNSWPELFDRLADRYDQVIPFFTAFATQLIEMIDPPVGTRLLDIGTGRGAIATAAAARGCRVTAVDAAPRMVSLLAAAHPEIDSRLMDIHQINLPDNSYDLATGGFVIHLVENPVQVLTELRRVLRPGATVALTTPGPYEDHGRWNAWNDLVDQFASRVADGRQPRRNLDVAPSLSAAGFVNVHTANLAVHLPVPDPQTGWDVHMSHGFAAGVEALNPSDAADFQRHAMTELARMHASGGIVLDRGAVVYLANVPAHDSPSENAATTAGTQPAHPESANLMAQRPADLATRERAREMPIYKRYFDLIAAGKKTIEVRVAYPTNKRLVAGQLLKFTCRGEECLTRIKRISSYLSFDEMFDHENVSTVNPTATRAEQLANIRLIYPAEKEALGVIAIEVERV